MIQPTGMYTSPSDLPPYYGKGTTLIRRRFEICIPPSYSLADGGHYGFKDVDIV